MKWLEKLYFQLIRIFGKIMNNIKTGKMSSKPKRPMIKKIVMAEVIDDEIFFNEKWIIVNHKGETLEAPIFTSKEDALNWLDQCYPDRDYAPE